MKTVRIFYGVRKDDPTAKNEDRAGEINGDDEK